MFAFLAILNRNGLNWREIDSRVDQAATRAFSFAKQLRSKTWSAPSGNARLWTWSNEPVPRTGAVDLEPETATVRLGFGGTGGACQIMADRLICNVTLARQEPIYYTVRDRQTIIGSRALLIALLLSKGGNLEYDYDALSACFVNGYNSSGFLTNRTPFCGVNLALPNAEIVATGQGLSIRDPDNLYRDFGFANETPDEAFYRSLADAFLGSLQSFVAAEPTGAVSVTGGKDSRLLAAALKVLGAKFEASTWGFDTDPDVVIGRRVAEFLGVPHQQYLPPRFESDHGNYLAIDARGEVARILNAVRWNEFRCPEPPPRRVDSQFLRWLELCPPCLSFDESRRSVARRLFQQGLLLVFSHHTPR